MHPGAGTKWDQKSISSWAVRRSFATPEGPNQIRVADASLAAHNRRYRDDMVGTDDLAHVPRKRPEQLMESRVILYFQTAAADRERERRLSRNSKYSVIPSPVLADSLKTCMPGRTA